MVTLLGFAIVLILLVVLIYVLKLFGWVMQKNNAPKSEKAAPKAMVKPVIKPAKSAEPTDEGTMAAIAMALAAAQSDDEAAIAMALHLYYNNAHDIQTTRLTMTGRQSAWNAKSFGMNNVGF